MANPDDEIPLRVVDRRWWARTDAADAAAEEEPGRKPTYVEELERRVADQATQLQAVLTERRRLVDEFEQVKSRMRRDVARDADRAKRVVLSELLEVLDNLDRAIAVARETGAADSLLRGVELVRDQFLAKLSSLGVSRVATLGERFDATRHEAVSTKPVDDPAHDERVVGVLKEGYAIGDDLLRPATVVVGRHGSSTPAE